MRVGILTGSVSRHAGGPFASLRGLAQSLRDDCGVNVRVFGLVDDATALDLPAWGAVPVRVEAVRGPRAFGYAPQLYDAVRRADLDVLHVACTWMYPTLVSLKWGRATGRPVVVAPHGDLDAWALANGRWKKALAAALYERRHLKRAATLHALNRAEARAFRDYGLANPIAVIPNGIDVPVTVAGGPDAGWSKRLPAGAKVLLFLGRLHPKKNIAALIAAWARVDRERGAANDWWLAIAGSGSEAYTASLGACIRETGARGVRFVGPQYGRAKAASFRRASAFVLPSLSEGLPMAVLEAWSYGLPAVVTPACNLPEGRISGAAIETGTTVDALAGGLRRLMAMSEGERAAMGRAGRRLTAERFSWRQVAGEMRALYGWLAEGDPLPRGLLYGAGAEPLAALRASAA